MSAQIIQFPKQQCLRPEEPWECDSDPVLGSLVRRLAVLHECHLLETERLTTPELERTLRKHGLPSDLAEQYLREELSRRGILHAPPMT